MFNKIFLFVLFFFTVKSYAVEAKFLADGYWLQKENNVNISIVHAHTNKNGNLEANIFVPLSDIESGKVVALIVYCTNCGKGDAYGNHYDYSNGTQTYQSIKFMWNAVESQDCAPGADGPVYDGGAVLDPYDGKYYHMKAQTLDYGKKIYVRAYWGYFGKDEYWDRLSKGEATKIKMLCGLTKNKVYSYQDSGGKIVNKRLFKRVFNQRFYKKFAIDDI